MKKLWVYLLALAAAVLCLLPAPAHAIGGTSHNNEHCVCGLTSHKAIGDHENEQTFNDWQGLDAVSLNNDQAELSSGSYYLNVNVTLEKTLKITGNVTICLSSHDLNCKGSPGIQIEQGATLNITNCGSSGNFCQKSTGRHIVNEGTLNLYGVTLHGDDVGYGVQNGDSGKTGTFTMYGGQIVRCKSETTVGAVQNYTGSTFTMYGGYITDNEMNGVGGVRNSGTMYMYGGEITRNKSTTGTAYGGVWNHGEMHLAGDAKITGNTGENGKDSNLVTEKAIYLDDALDNAASIGLRLDAGIAEDTVILQGSNYTITAADVEKFTLESSHPGKALTLCFPSGTVKLMKAHNHTLCNAATHTGPGHSGSCNSSVTFRPWDSKTSLPDKPGCYYLTENVTLNRTAEIGKDITICLNGHTITKDDNQDTIDNQNTINVKGGGELTVTDCKNNTGKITHEDGTAGNGVEVAASGRFHMYGGQITGNGSNGYGINNVYVSGEFYMYGGRITSSNQNGYSVYVHDGTFEMNCAIGDEPAISNTGGCAVVVNMVNMSTVNRAAFRLKNGYIEGGGNSGKYAVVVPRGTIGLDGTVRIGGGLNLPVDNHGGVLSVSSGFRLAAGSEKIQLTLGGEDVSGYFDSTQSWPQNTLNKFAGKDEKVFVQTDVANTTATIRLLTPVAVPAAKTGLTYNGAQQIGVEADTGYIVTNGFNINAGGYTAVGKIEDEYVWQTSDGYEQRDQFVYWTIAQKDPEAEDFTVTGLGNYPYDGTAKTVTAALADKYPEQTDPLTWTVFYTKGGVTTDIAPADAGTYEVTLKVSGNRNFKAGTVQLGTLHIGSISQNAPTGLTGVAPTTADGTDGKITGVDTSMEYKVENDTSWTLCTGDTITGLSAGTYQVRYQADANHEASDAATVVVPAYVPSLVTVRFLSGGGSGDMSDVSRYPGAYTLPACGFTAPEGKEFDKWQGIDGATYAVGDTYNVTGDTELTALWKNKAVTPDPDPVTPDPDPVTPDPDPVKPDPDPDKPKPSRPSRPSGSGSSGPVITALPTADGLSPTNYSGGIYGLTFRSSASFSSFRGVKVDGVMLDASCYTAEEGSILVYLKAAYLKTLKEGTHTLTILSTEGDTTMQFTIGAVASARTFDAGVTGYAVTALLSLGGALGLRRRKNGLI